MHRAQEFARLSGVTVRALHHYDRLGLLRPRRSAAGYRLYGDREMARLEQIVALKFIGIPLQQIRTLLDRKDRPLVEALGAQRRALEEKRQWLDRAIAAILKVEAVVHAGQRPDAALLQNIIEVIAMQEKQDWTAKYANDAAKAKLKERQKLWSPELQERVGRQWMELIGQVETAVQEGVEPSSDRARVLADRWQELVEGFTGGDPDLTQTVRNVWADRANWPPEACEQTGAFQIRQEVWQFIKQARGGGECG
jgi:DNA-binding transcriptional MerR regulator